jgi:hypothetical protein
MPFENSAWQAKANQECGVNPGHRLRGERAVDCAKPLLIDRANLIAKRVAVFAGAAVASLNRHVDG